MAPPEAYVTHDQVEAMTMGERVAATSGGQVVVGMRPEHFVPGGEAPEGATWLSRKVDLVEMLGAEMLVHFETKVPPVVTDDMREAIDDEEAFEQLKEDAKSGGQQFVARLDPGPQPKIGSQIALGFRMDRLHFFDLDSGLALT